MDGLVVGAPGCERDFVLLKWWSQMVESGELLDVFADQAGSPTGFLALFSSPATVVFYRTDDQGVAVVMWFEPFMGNVSLGMWCRKDWRKRRWWDDLVAALRLVLAEHPMVLFLTKRPHVVQSGLAVGFKHVGEVPYLYRGELGHVCYITRERFKDLHG